MGQLGFTGGGREELLWDEGEARDTGDERIPRSKSRSRGGWKGEFFEVPFNLNGVVRRSSLGFATQCDAAQSALRSIVKG
jgi:hypothetical protein